MRRGDRPLAAAACAAPARAGLTSSRRRGSFDRCLGAWYPAALFRSRQAPGSRGRAKRRIMDVDHSTGARHAVRVSTARRDAALVRDPIARPRPALRAGGPRSRPRHRAGRGRRAWPRSSRSLAALLQGSDELRRALLDPALGADARRRVLARPLRHTPAPRRCCAGCSSSLASHDRVSLLPALAEAYEEARQRRARAVVTAEAVTATPLDRGPAHGARAAPLRRPLGKLRGAARPRRPGRARGRPREGRWPDLRRHRARAARGAAPAPRLGDASRETGRTGWRFAPKRSPGSSASSSGASPPASTSPRSAPCSRVGDGIARIHGLERCMAGELLELPHGVMGLALNLEEDSVGAVLLGEYQLIREGDEVRRTKRIMSRPGRRRAGRPRRERRSASRSTARERSPPTPSARSSASPPASSTASRSRSRCRPASRRSTRWCRSAAASAS